MTTIDFYFNAEAPLEVACRLTHKAHAQKNRVLVYAPQGALAQQFDRMLWTWQATGFVPHCMAHDPLAADTPVLIASDDTAPEPCEVLLNLGEDCPPHFERFERLLEIVARDEAAREAGRERFRFYRSRGYPIRNHDLAAQRGARRGADGDER